jgi:hypothetical protein
MTGPGEPPLDDPQQEAYPLGDLVLHVGGLLLRYEKRERADPADVIGGSSRFLLPSLLKASLAHLPPGPVRDAVSARVSDQDSGQPDTALRVSDELDLLREVAVDLQRVLENTPKPSSPPGATSGDRQAGRSGQYRKRPSSAGPQHHPPVVRPLVPENGIPAGQRILH